LNEFLIQLLHGLTLGALFAQVAIGYTMVYGIIKLINFAHSEFYMAGGFAGLLSLAYLCGPGKPLDTLPGSAQLLLGVLLAGLLVAALAVLTERLAYRPIRSSGRIAALLTAVGVSLLLQNSFIAVFGNRETAFPHVLEDARYPRWRVALDELQPGQVSEYLIAYRTPIRDWKGNVLKDANEKPLGYSHINLVRAGQAVNAKNLEQARSSSIENLYAYPAVTVSKKQGVIFFSLLLSSLALFVLVQHTRVGRAMRAVSHDFETASLMGINTSAIVALTFAVGGFLAGMGGVLAGGMFIGTVAPMMGFMLGLKAFVAAVLGGIGSIPGALLGGLALGLVEQMTQHYADRMFFQGASAYRDAIAFLILIGILLVRPTGLLGRFEGEKV